MCAKPRTPSEIQKTDEYIHFEILIEVCRNLYTGTSNQHEVRQPVDIDNNGQVLQNGTSDDNEENIFIHCIESDCNSLASDELSLKVAPTGKWKIVQENVLSTQLRDLEHRDIVQKTYHSQRNEKLEGIKRKILEALRHYISYYPKYWYLYTDYLTYTYNTHVNIVKSLIQIELVL